MPVFRHSIKRALSVAAVALLAAPAFSEAAGGVALFNLQKSGAASICEIAASAGAGAAAEVRQNKPLPEGMRFVVVSAESRLKDDEVAQIGESVRNGAALLVVFPAKAGTDAFKLSAMLPTMGWAHSYAEQGPYPATEFDPTFFGSSAELKDLTIPYLHQIRPFHAAERGQARYDRLERQVLFTSDDEQKFLPPGSNEWSRPLLNHDWQIRARVEGDLGLPLLITGEYGRGRVAVFASGADALDNSPQGKAFWADTIKWLLRSTATAGQSSPAETCPAPAVTVDRPHRLLHVEAHNPGSSLLQTTVIARVMTWEPALIGDVERPLNIPARASASIDIPLPANDDKAYAAIAERDEFTVRLGMLSADGSTLLNEQSIDADLRPPVLMRLDSDDVRNYPWPFAPGDSLPEESRMGTRMDEYAYKPGETLHAQITFDNGTRNIAALAKPHDETTPDNPSTSALNHGYAAGERQPDSSLREYGYWIGQKGKDNIVTLTFPRPVLINAIHLIGAASGYRLQDKKNPSAVIIEIDGKEVAREMGLADRFLSEKGDVRLPFDAVRGTTIRLQFPWQDGANRNDPVIGDIQVWGTTDENLPPAAHGTAALSLYNALSGESTAAGSKPIEIAPGAHAVVPLDVVLPAGDGKPVFYQLVATFAGDRAARPVMTITPDSILPSYESLHENSVGAGFIVTRGFRNVFPIGTGAAEMTGSWESPDDLVWAYEHGLKENGDRSPYLAAKLYVTENDMRHYSTQWRHFQDGEVFYDVGAPALVANFEKKKDWATAYTVALGHSDRWDCGPPVMEQFSWPEFIAFDQWLRAKHLGQLKSKTKQDLVIEVHTQYLGPWFAYHLEQYSRSVGVLKDAFAAAGKKLLITAQGCPLVPPAFARTISEVIKGSSDDSTWGMQHDDIITTTGKQMGALAFNPYLQMCTLGHWGHNSNTLNNPQWHVPIGTTEPSRRHLFDRAFRGVIRMDGTFTSMHSYGFNSNLGDPMTLTSVDYDQWKRVRDLFVLLRPDAPLGAGLVIGNAYLNNPLNTRFSGSAPEGSDESHAIMTSLGLFEKAGISIPFSANVLALDQWTGKAPLIVLNLEKFQPEEIAVLRKTMQRGVRVAAFYSGEAPLPAEAAALFGVDAHGSPANSPNVYGKSLGNVDGHPIVACGNSIFVPLSAETMRQEQVDSIASILLERLDIPIRFDSGSSGYGFTSNGREFVEIEDWREEARTLQLRVHSNGGNSAIAVGVNDSVSLPVKKDGDDWLIAVPTRAGDGNVICIQEH